MCSQRNYTVALLDRYRKALETAVQISCRHNVPPLPGRTLILLSPGIYYDQSAIKKLDFCLPPDPEEQENEEKEAENPKPKRRKMNIEDHDKLTPSVTPYIFIYLFFLCLEKVWHIKMTEPVNLSTHLFIMYLDRR